MIELLRHFSRGGGLITEYSTVNNDRLTTWQFNWRMTSTNDIYLMIHDFPEFWKFLLICLYFQLPKFGDSMKFPVKCQHFNL